MLYKQLAAFAIVTVFLFFSGNGQSTKGGAPLLLINSDLNSAKYVKKTSMDAEISLIDEIGQMPENLYAISKKTNFSFQKQSQKINWNELSSTWVVNIDNPRNDQIQLLLSTENLPPSARVFITDPAFKKIIGAYDLSLFTESKRLLTDAISTNKIVVMIDFSSKISELTDLLIERIYRSPNKLRFPNLENLSTSKVDTGFGTSYPCHINVNCPEGNDYQIQKNGVVRVHMVLAEGLGWCSGSLINNTAQDERPYILTAFHCQDGYTPFFDLWRFDFNYESNQCSNPPQEPAKLSNTGCSWTAGRQESDFLLLEMEDPVPAGANAYFNGWDRSTDYIPGTAAIIHHPNGDIKKISKEMNLVTIFPNQINWSSGVTTPPAHHYRCNLDEGTQQGGSSGSPFLDQNGRIIGQLHGGVTDDEQCDLAISYFGRFQMSWGEGDSAESRLKEWLDPMDLNPIILDGMEASSVELGSIAGIIATPNDKRIANVKVVLSGDQSGETFTNVNGQFSFNDLASNGQYSLVFEKLESPGSGVSGIDMVLVINHLLGLNPFVNMFSNMAADASGDGNVSGLDLVQMRNVILGLWSEFPNKDVWQFLPSEILLNNPTDFSVELEVKGVKTGDVNFSVDTSN